jgi:hypothetical protein
MLTSSMEEKEKQQEALPFLNFLTLNPVGNPLLNLSQFQRQFFFESLLRLLHVYRVEDAKRLEASGLNRQGAALVSSCVASVAALRAEAERQKAQASVLAGKKEKKEGVQGGFGGPAGQGSGMKVVSQNSLVFGSKSREVSSAAEKLAFVLDDYARGDGAKAAAALSEFQSRLSSQNYKADDLMAVLLLVVEDEIWSGEEGSIGGAKGAGAGMRTVPLPPRLRETAKESAEVRLASVREMLRHYFRQHPKDYASALASALGITADQEEDTQFLQERLAYELARVGGFALSQRILAEAKLKKKMDAKKCMLELGYFYDKKKRKLVIGKRTCGRAADAKDIMDLLLSGLKGSS